MRAGHAEREKHAFACVSFYIFGCAIIHRRNHSLAVDRCSDSPFSLLVGQMLGSFLRRSNERQLQRSRLAYQETKMRHSKKRGRRSKSPKRSRRRLRVQSLEQRQLLAADLSMHNAMMPEDVDGNGTVTALDAMIIINEISDQAQRGSGGIEFVSNERSDDRFMRDVTADGRVTALDAMRIINHIADASERRAANRGDTNQPPTDPTSDPAADEDAVEDTDDGVADNADEDVDDGVAEEAVTDEVRSIDGTGNNLEDPTLGSAHTELARIVRRGLR